MKYCGRDFPIPALSVAVGKSILFFLILPLILSAQILRMKRIVYLPSGLRGADILCADTDHNGSNELILTVVNCWKIWKHRPINQYQLVYANTGAFPYPPGIETGNFEPSDVGDIGRDSLTDLVALNVEQSQNPNIFYNVISTQESPNYSYYPQSLTWWYRFAENMTVANPSYFTNDLDDDTKREIIAGVPNLQIGLGIWENVANNQNELVWHRTREDGWAFAFGDFDLDEGEEFATTGLGSLGRVFIYKNTGDNQYELVMVDTVHIPDGADVFSGSDLDGDGKPEFFVGFAQFVSGNIWDFYLYLWEPTGDDTYEKTFIERIRTSEEWERRSECGDIDGDGIEEFVWSIGEKVFVYKAIGNNQFQILLGMAE